MEANKKKNAKKENIWTADANSDVRMNWMILMILMKPKLSTNSLAVILNL